MPEGHSPAVYVHLVTVEVQVAHELLGDDSERLVHLEQVHVVDGHTGSLEDLAGGGHRRVEHECGVVAHVRAGDDARPRGEAVGLHVGFARVEDGGGAVDDARRVARMMDVGDVEVSVLLVYQLAERGHAVSEAVVGDVREAWRQCGERVGGGTGSRELVVV